MAGQSQAKGVGAGGEIELSLGMLRSLAVGEAAMKEMEIAIGDAAAVNSGIGIRVDSSKDWRCLWLGLSSVSSIQPAIIRRRSSSCWSSGWSIASSSESSPHAHGRGFVIPAGIPVSQKRGFEQCSF